MRTVLAVFLVFAVACGGTALAKKKKKDDGKLPITEVNALSITVSLGKDGNVHETYSISSTTKVTINGAPGNARDLVAGMVAKIDVSDDGMTALSIDATDPPENTHNRHH